MLSADAIAQTENNSLLFSHINYEHGLSQGDVRNILSDHFGFMWFAMRSGLDRYDGIKIISYKHDSTDVFSLSNNEITCLYDDGINLWAGTFNAGLNKYDFSTGKFYHYRHDEKNKNSISSDNVTAITKDKQNRIWIGTSDGLNLFDPSKGIFQLVQFPEEHQKTNSYINGLLCDSHGLLWIASYRGCCVYNPQNMQFTFFENFPGYTEHLQTHQAWCFAEDKESNIWIGGGLTKYVRSENKFIYYPHKDNDENSPAGEYITTLLCDNDGKTWIGTNNGITSYDPGIKKFTRHMHKPGNSKSLGNNVVRSLYQDKNGIVWVGCADGISKTDPFSNKFRTYQQNPGDKNSLSTNVTRNIIQGKNGFLWVATEQGVNRFNLKTGEKKVFINPVTYGHMMQYITWALHEDNEGNIWIGTWGGGLHKLNPEKNTFEVFLADTKVSEGYVISIVEDLQQHLWLATWGGGVYMLDIKTKKIKQYLPDSTKKNSIRSKAVYLIFIDHEKNIWAAGPEGLDKYRPATDDFEYFDGDKNMQVPVRNVSAMTETNDGFFWVGTMQGLYRINKVNKLVERFTTYDGLPSDDITGIVEDNDRNLWISTSSGLAMMSKDASCKKPQPGNKLLVKDCDLFTRYTTNDGLPSNIFMGSSACKDSDGNIYFGSVAGMIAFDPKKMIRNSVPPDVFITSIKKQNTEVLSRNELFSAKELVLRHKENAVSFEFAALNFNQPDKNQFAYMLEGQDAGWQYSGTRNFTSYTNLNAGTYTFRVKAANNDGVWNETEATLSVVVLPPWWKTWWFYSLCIVAAAAAVSVYTQLRTRTLKKQKRILEETVAQRTVELSVQKERAEQSEKFKEQFLANMSHEIRTPMNAVTGMTNILLEKNPSSEQQKYLNTIKKSSETLLVIINDILDLSKIEAGKMEFEKTAFHPNEPVELVYQTLQHKAEEKGLEFKIDYDKSIPPVLIGDPTRLNQVLINLTGNAIKFTEKGSVTIEVRNQKSEVRSLSDLRPPTSHLTFSIRDTGIGMTQEQMTKIFESFSQASGDTTRKYGGTGLGLSISKQLVELQGGKISVESVPGKGSTFSFGLQYEISSDKIVTAKESLFTTEMQKRLDGIKILIAEDNKYNRMVVTDTLTHKLNNIIIDEAHNGAEALQKLKASTYHIILMDIQMPVMDGYEATRKIRNEFSAPKNKTPILALSASVVRADIDKCIAAGMNGYVPKPFRTSELLIAIYNAVYKKEQTIITDTPTENGSPANGRVTDITFLRNFAEGNTEKMKRFIRLYLESVNSFIEELKNDMAKNNLERIATTVHSLKPKFSMMGMKEARTLCVEIEKQCKENHLPANDLEKLIQTCLDSKKELSEINIE